jgi:ribonuclease Z
MLMRLNLDKVNHTIDCYYPKSGKKYFDRLRYSSMYHEKIKVAEHPIEGSGLVHDDGNFEIWAESLDHGVDNFAYRVQEKDERKYYKDKLLALGIKGDKMKELRDNGQILIDGKIITEEEMSYMRKGDSFVYISDTKYCDGLKKIAKDATLILSESTYLEIDKDMAYKHKHLTARGAAEVAKDAGAKMLVLTHFSARYLDLTPFEQEARKTFANTFVAEDLKKFPFIKTLK